MSSQPWLAIPLVGGLLLGFGALLRQLNSVAFGEPLGSSARGSASYVPLYGHLSLVVAAGIFLPGALVSWFQTIAKLLG
jgi:hydrogenase-4 component F